jgi:hypothetical protein
VRVVGTLVRSERPQQPVEVISENIEVLGGCNFKVLYLVLGFLFLVVISITNNNCWDQMYYASSGF